VLGLLALVVGGGFVIGVMALARFAAARFCGVRARGAWLFSSPDAWRDVPRAKRVGFTAAGLVGYWCAAAIVLAAGFAMEGETRIDETSMRVNVSAGGPADRAGMRDGDRIVAVDDVTVQDWDALKTECRRHAGEQMSVHIERDGQPLVLTVTPSGADAANKGKIMVGPPYDVQRIGFGAALAKGFVAPAEVLKGLLVGVVHMVSGHDAELSGPVAVVRETDGVARTSGLGATLKLVGAIMSYLFYLAVILSVATFPRAHKKTREAAQPSA
jgi:membrane-associated protease RseP (regulator of RpoE activity)